MTPEQRADRGCDGPSPRIVARVAGHEFRECPSKLIESWAATVVMLHGLATVGSLPDSGGVLDQSAWLMHAIGVVQKEFTRHQEAEMERSRG